jgi:hypothetical protein
MGDDRNSAAPKSRSLALTLQDALSPRSLQQFGGGAPSRKPGLGEDLLQVSVDTEEQAAVERGLCLA